MQNAYFDSKITFYLALYKSSHSHQALFVSCPSSNDNENQKNNKENVCVCCVLRYLFDETETDNGQSSLIETIICQRKISLISI